MNNKSKINTSKGKVYIGVVAIAAVLMMSFNMNANMISNMNAYATIMSEIPNIDDIGQSAECVIVVVGCDGTGSVGSSGDTVIGSFNGNDDNNTNGGGDTPIPPIDPTQCELCLGEELSADQLVQLRVALGLDEDASLLEICAAIGALASVEALVTLLGGIGLTAEAILDLLVCLGIEITLPEIIAILGIGV